MNALIEKAKTSKVRKNVRPFTDEEIELALAYLAGEVNFAGVALAIGSEKSPTRSYIFLTRALREAAERGLLIIND